VIDGLALASSGPMAPMSIDPAFYSFANNPQFTGLEYDSLVNFQQSPGAAGLRLVPDLALSIPTPTEGGTTYAFRLRPGIHYSSGQPLRAGDFRRAIERLFRAGSPGTGFYTSILGAAGCARRPSRCDLSRGIVTDDAAGTVVFHLTAPDPAFLYELTEQDYTAPVPAVTPNHDNGLNPIPGTGPYRIVRADRTGVYFARNPFFREWSHAAQPNGSPDMIVWRYLPSQHVAATAVRRDRADWLAGLIPLPDYRQLAIQSPAQLHTNPLFAIEFFALNTHLAPFNNVLVREALNYAIDRRVIARMYGGPAFATPTCQPLAPGLPGYRRYCPYSAHPGAGESYNGPDLSHAKRLDGVARYGFPESVRRHFERLDVFPRGLLPIGDAICRFNPVYGQGMSVAALEACLLRRLLGRLGGDSHPIAELAPTFFAEIQTLIETPWSVAILDFVFPDTRGQRPADFETTLKFGIVLTRLAAEDPDVHKLTVEVQHLLRPRSVYRDPALVQRVLARMVEA